MDQGEEHHQNRRQENRNKMITYRTSDFDEVMAIDLTEWYDGRNNKKFIIRHMIA